MYKFSPDVELSIDLAASEIAKTISDRYASDFKKMQKNLNAMIRMAVSSSCVEQSWVKSSGDDQWLRNSEEVVQLDGAALDRAIGRWWSSLDDKTKLDELSKSFQKTFFVNLKQKYQPHPASLAQEIPALDKAYQEELDPSKVPVPPTSPAPAAVPTEEAPSA